MERKNKFLVISLAVLSAITALLFLFKQTDKYTLADPEVFKVNQLDKVDHIVLESNEQKVDLHYADGRWKVNERYDADKKLITVLFATVEQVLPKREIAPSKKDSIASELQRRGVKVSLYEGDQLRKSFLAGGNTPKSETYFQAEDGKIYLMNIPGYRVYVAGIFEAGEGIWRDKRVFNFNWRNFKDLTARFPAEPASNFHVTFKEKFFGIDGINAIDTAKVNDYLESISLLQASEYLSAKAAARFDSLLRSGPSFEVEVKDIADRAYVLKVFPPQKGTSSIIGLTNKEEVLLFEGKDIAPVAKKKSWFVAK
jgi:hypothetical protein